MVKKYFGMLKNEFSGYNGGKLVKDLMAGLTVAAVSLPLALAFGVASGADAPAGLVTAIVAGIVISLLSGASFQISGPTGTMTAVLVTLGATVGINGIFMACFLAGFIRLFCGIFKLGKLVSLIPRPVITGFTSGISIIIALGQVDNFFGTASKGDTAIEKIGSYFTLGFVPDLWAVLLGVIVVALMILWPKKWNAKVPSSLVALIVATAVFMIFRFEGIATVGDIPKTLLLPNRLTFKGVDLEFIKAVIPASFSVAALCMIESLLCGASAARMKNEPFDANIELIGQAAGNIIIPFFGGVPATAALARTSVAIKSGSQTRLAGIFHSVWLIAAMFLLGGVISQVPMSALGGVLMITAWRMNDWDSIKRMFKKKFAGPILQYLITMTATVVFDLTVAIVIGIIFSLMVFIKNAAHLDVTHSEVSAERLAAKGSLAEGHENSVVIYVTGDIFFANIEKLTAKMKELTAYDEILISLRGVPDMDVCSIDTFGETVADLTASGKRIVLCSMNESVERVFKKSGVLDEHPEIGVYATIDKALICESAMICEVR